MPPAPHRALCTAPSPAELCFLLDTCETQDVIAVSVNYEKCTYLKLSICLNPSASIEIKRMLYFTMTKGSDEWRPLHFISWETERGTKLFAPESALKLSDNPSPWHWVKPQSQHQLPLEHKAVPDYLINYIFLWLKKSLSSRFGDCVSIPTEVFSPASLQVFPSRLGTFSVQQHVEMSVAVEIWPRHFWLGSIQVQCQAGVCTSGWIISRGGNWRHRILTVLWEHCVTTPLLVLLSEGTVRDKLFLEWTNTTESAESAEK